MSGTPNIFGVATGDGTVTGDDKGESVDCVDLSGDSDEVCVATLSKDVDRVCDGLESGGKSDDVGEVSLHIKLKRYPMTSASYSVDPAAFSYVKNLLMNAVSLLYPKCSSKAGIPSTFFALLSKQKSVLSKSDTAKNAAFAEGLFSYTFAPQPNMYVYTGVSAMSVAWS